MLFMVFKAWNTRDWVGVDFVVVYLLLCKDIIIHGICISSETKAVLIKIILGLH